MDLKTILKIHVQQQQANILHQVFQCLQYHNLKTENKHDVYSGKDGMKKFCEPLREHSMKKINFKIKK